MLINTNYFNYEQLNNDQVKSVVNSVTDASSFTGLTVGGEKYILVRSDPGASISILKKGPAGIVACKSTQSNLRFFLS